MGRIRNYPEIKDLQAAMEYLGGREVKKLANNTYLHRNRDGSVSVRLFRTDIVVFTTSGDVILSDGGWDSVVTRDRINEHLPRPLGLIREKGRTWLWNGLSRWDWDGSYEIEGVHA